MQEPTPKTTPGTILTHRLRDAMDESNMTGAALARATGIQRSEISRYRAGKVDPRPPTVRRMARALGVSAEWLTGESGDRRAEP